jgi:hypothetical protein
MFSSRGRRLLHIVWSLYFRGLREDTKIPFARSPALWSASRPHWQFPHILEVAALLGRGLLSCCLLGPPLHLARLSVKGSTYIIGLGRHFSGFHYPMVSCWIPGQPSCSLMLHYILWLHGHISSRPIVICVIPGQLRPLWIYIYVFQSSPCCFS